MKKETPAQILEEIAAIQRMEPGKLCVIRNSPEGPYYNLQCRENGRTVSRYIPRDQAEVVTQHTANHKRFKTLVDEYAHGIIELTRKERIDGFKKKKPPKGFSLLRTKKSKH
jgi:hypothetical protein